MAVIKNDRAMKILIGYYKLKEKKYLFIQVINHIHLILANKKAGKVFGV